MTSFVLVKVAYKKDIRVEGTGNVGARNAGRVYGKAFFLVTFLGDALKGSIVIFIARYFDFSSAVQLFGLGMVILGHIKPIFLRFNGGKGVSTFIGGVLAFEPLLALVIILGFIITYPFTKSFTISGLLSFIFIPIFIYMYFNSYSDALILLAIIMIVVLAHSENIMERIRGNERKK